MTLFNLTETSSFGTSCSTPPPTDSPTDITSSQPPTSSGPTCVDSTGSLPSGQNCAFIAADPDNRCGLTDPATGINPWEACPLTCDNCSQCVDEDASSWSATNVNVGIPILPVGFQVTCTTAANVDLSASQCASLDNPGVLSVNSPFTKVHSEACCVCGGGTHVL